MAAQPVPALWRVSIPPLGGSGSASRCLRQARRVEQAAPIRLDDGRDAAVDAELAHRVREVLLHRVAAEEEAAADLAVRAPLRGEGQDFQLLARERRPRLEHGRSGARIDERLPRGHPPHGVEELGAAAPSIARRRVSSSSYRAPSAEGATEAATSSVAMVDAATGSCGFTATGR